MEGNLSVNALKAGVDLEYQPVREIRLPQDTGFSRWIAPGIAEIRGTKMFQTSKLGVFHAEKGLLAGLEYTQTRLTGSGLVHLLHPKRAMLITQEGKVLTGADCDSARDIGEGMFAEHANKKWTIRRVDTGEQVTGRSWLGLTDFHEGTCAVQAEDGWQIIGTDGQPVLPGKWETAHPFKNGFARVGSKKETIYINREGREIFRAAGPYCRDFWNGYAVFQDRGLAGSGKLGVINEEGKVVIEPKYLFIRDCGSDMFVVSNSGTNNYDHTSFNGKDFGLLRTDGSVVLPQEYSKIEPRPDGSYLFGKMSGWQIRSGNTVRTFGVLVFGIIGADGKVILPDRYVSVGEESEGLRAFKSYDGTKLVFGYMNPDNSIAFTVSEIDYSSDNDQERTLLRGDLSEQMRPFQNGKAMVAVRTQKKTAILGFRNTTWYAAAKVDWYLIGRDGKEVEPDPEDNLQKNPYSSRELPFGDNYRNLAQFYQTLAKDMSYAFDNYYEVNYAPGAFAILDRDLHCVCSNFLPKTAFSAEAAKSPAHPKYLQVTEIAPNIWLTVTENGQSMRLSEFESPTLFSSGLAPYSAQVEKHKVLWGYMDRNGKTVVEPKYTSAKGFVDGYATAKDGKTSVILSRDVAAKEREPGEPSEE